MARIEVVSTDGLSGRKKVEYWNDIATSAMMAMTADPADVATFCGRMRRADVGEVRAVEVFSHGARVQRSPGHIAHSGETAFLLELQVDGTSTARQGGREAPLGAGDFTLLDSARPFEVRCAAPMKLLVFKVPRALLGKYLGCAEAMAAIPMCGERTSNELASRFLRDLWRWSSTALDDSGRPEHGARAALELIAYAYGALPAARAGSVSAAGAHRIRVLDYVETHLSDPGLSPASIAKALRISCRYLHRVWKAEDGESLSRYVLRRRLEECARALRDPLYVRRSITAIAFDWGFVGMPHFCSTFREQYGVPPGEYRLSPAVSKRFAST
jgi:AraC-like DNA-binding protein